MAKMGKSDFSELEAFAKQLEKLDEEKIQEISEACIKELAARLLRLLIKNTPVGLYDQPVNFTTKDGAKVSFTPHTGKQGGTLRRGWSSVKIEVKKAGNMYTIDLENPIEYASWVNYGHRKVNRKGEKVGWTEGLFFVERSQGQLKADAIVEQRLQKMLREAFNESK